MNGDPEMTENKLSTGQKNAQLETVEIKLYALLARQTAKYTLNDSTSLPVELAEDLFYGICYCLGIKKDMPEEALAELAETDFDVRLAEGIRLIQKQMRLAKKLWRTAMLSLPRIENTSLTDTLNSIKTFEKRYDYRFFAHHIPCDIDYQLCHPVPEEQQGIGYVIDWLTHLLTENTFFSHFAPEDCIAVLAQSCPDYIGLHINLYEPVAVQALGLAMIDGDVLGLRFTEPEHQRLTDMLKSAPPSARADMLADAADFLIQTFHMESRTSREYLLRTAKNALPRINAALGSGTLIGVFYYR